jgi:hypothetical protein
MNWAGKRAAMAERGMNNATDRFQFPFILPGQAQKELFHNEALALVDAALHPAVETAPVADAPMAPAPGQSWIVASAALGAWAGKEGHIANFTEAGWRFIAPQPGMMAWNKAAGLWLIFDGLAWTEGVLPATALVINGQQVVGPRRAAIASPSGGGTIDVEARAAINEIIATFM